MNQISATQEICECGAKLYWETRTSKWCYACSTSFEIEDERSAVEKLEADFNEGLQTGSQLDVLQEASRLVADEFAYTPDFAEIENPEFEEHLAEMESNFDTWWATNPNSPRVKFTIGAQCRNFITAIQQKYISVALVKTVTNSMNSRERSLVWATWKGMSHRVYYPK